MNSTEPRLLPELPAGADDQPAIAHGEHRLTHGMLRSEVARLAGALRQAGVRRSDRVLLLFPNGPEHVVALLAVTSLGAIAVPVRAESSVVRLRQVIEVTEPRLIVAGAGVPVPGEKELEIFPYTVAAPEHRAEAASAPPWAGDDLTPDLPALILFSSGSTGRPKGVVLSHAQLLWTAAALGRRFHLAEGHRELVFCPLAHSGAWQRVAATLRVGGCVHLDEGLLSVAGLLEEMVRHGCRGFYTPPPMIRMLLRDDPAKVRSGLAGCEGIEIGSAAIGSEELRHLLDLLPATRVYVHYGMTEVSRAFILDARARPDKLATVGQPNGVEVEIRAPDGRVLPAGESGEIFLRGPQQATGYWRPPPGSQRAFLDGWVQTGDYGRLDQEGFLTFLGRADDLISTAGHHFYPAEVEAQLGPVPGVKEYLIAGVPDPRGIQGEVPWAFVVPEAPESWKPTSFLAVARRRLSAWMLPRWVVPIPAVPLTASRKPDRRRVVAEFGPRTDAARPRNPSAHES